MKKKFLIWTFILIILVFTFGFALSQLYNEFKKVEKYEFTPNTIPNSEQEILDNCQNLDLTDSVFCLRDNIKTFYNYTITDDNLDLTFLELKKLGGDCKDYSFLYSGLGEKLGFNSTTTKYEGVRGVFDSHKWAVIWDETHNCELDLLSINCYENIKR